MTDRALYLSNLGAVLGQRYDEIGDRDDLKKAIEVFEESLKMTPETSPVFATRLSMLGMALLYRFKNEKDLADIEQAITLLRKAVGLSIGKTSDFSMCANKLGLALCDRYEITNDLKDIDEAISILTDAADADLLGGMNLAIALKSRFIRTGNFADLDNAIEILRKVIKQTKLGPIDEARCLNNLSASLWERHRRFHIRADLEMAIKAARRALELTPKGSRLRISKLVNFGNALQDLFIFKYSGSIKDIDASVEAFQEAKVLEPGDSAILNNLANALGYRYELSKNPGDLDRSVEFSRQAVELKQPDSVDRAQFLGSHALSLERRYKLRKEQSDLDKAINVYRESCIEGIKTAPEECLRSSINWEKWASERKCWKEASEAGTYGLKALDSLFHIQALRTQKEIWLKNAEDLHVRTAYALVKNGDLQAAVEAMERGNARMLAEALSRDPTNIVNLEQIRPDLAARYCELVREIAKLQAEEIQAEELPKNVLLALSQTNKALDLLITQIQEIDGFKDFQKPIEFETIKEATQLKPLIYFVVVDVGSAALLVEADGSVTPIWLPSLTEQELFKRLSNGAKIPRANSYFGRYNRVLHHIEDANAMKHWLKELDKTTAWIWKTFMHSVVAVLEERSISKVVLIPQGLLVTLPLHAAWTRNKSFPGGRHYALDNICFTYAASARALLKAQKQVMEISKREKILVIENPDNSLRYARNEAIAALAHFAAENKKVLGGMAAQREKVMEYLPDFNVIHFATHGKAMYSQPIESGLVMAYGEQLTLKDFFSLTLTKVRLAVLSACETGIPGTWLPNEIVSLPTALMQAGAAGILASLWFADDAVTMMLMFRFYELWRKQHLEPSEALQQVQTWWRSTNDIEKRAYFKSRMLEDGCGGLIAKAAEDAYKYLMLRKKNSHPLHHPYYWAAFFYTGI